MKTKILLAVFVIAAVLDYRAYMFAVGILSWLISVQISAYFSEN